MTPHSISSAPGFRQGVAVSDVRPAGVPHCPIHYIEVGAADGVPIVLIPGWPQTWYAWRRVMPFLAAAGHRVVALDPPGLGESGMFGEDTQYDTAQVADVLHAALASLGIQGAIIVGHDVGAWIAYAFACRHPAATRRLVLLEAAIPGVTPDTAFGVAHAPKVFQFYLNAVPELPELLVKGKEREFLAWLFRTKSADPNTIGPADLDEYLRSYADPARMSAGFGYYRAVPADIEQNSAAGRLAMPVLALGGAMGVGTALHDALRARALDLRGGAIDGSGHFLPEECHDELARRILAFAAENEP